MKTRHNCSQTVKICATLQCTGRMPSQVFQSENTWAKNRLQRLVISVLHSKTMHGNSEGTAGKNEGKFGQQSLQIRVVVIQKRSLRNQFFNLLKVSEKQRHSKVQQCPTDFKARGNTREKKRYYGIIGSKEPPKLLLSEEKRYLVIEKEEIKHQI